MALDQAAQATAVQYHTRRPVPEGTSSRVHMALYFSTWSLIKLYEGFSTFSYCSCEKKTCTIFRELGISAIQRSDFWRTVLDIIVLICDIKHGLSSNIYFLFFFYVMFQHFFTSKCDLFEVKSKYQDQITQYHIILLVTICFYLV